MRGTVPQLAWGIRHDERPIMLSNPLPSAGDATFKRAAPEPASCGTACRGTAADTSPDELSLLADQLTGFRQSAPLLRVQCLLEQARSFVAGHVVTTAVAIGVLATAIFVFLER